MRDKWLPIFYIGLFTVFDPITFDFLVTALPLIAGDLQVTPGELTGLISYYLLGVGFAQLWSGEFVDRYGQRLAIRTGAVSFLFFSCLAARSSDLLVWNISRFATGIAVGLCITASLALVRERYAEEGGKILSIIYGAGNFVGVLSPLLAGILIANYGWPSVFWAIASWGILLVGVAFSLIPKSRMSQHQDFSLAQWFDDYCAILRVRPYVLWAVISALAYGSFLSFITGSSFVLTEGFGLSSTQYSYAYSFIVGIFVVGSLYAQKLRADPTLVPLFGRYTLVLCLSGAGIVLNALLWNEFYVLLMALGLMSFTTALLIPHGMALALLPFEDNKGKASAGIIIAHVIIGAVIGWLVTIAHRPDGMMIGISILIQALWILLLLRLIKHPNSQL